MRLAQTAAVVVFCLAAVAAPGRAQGTVFMTVPEALELAFPECEVERTRVVLGTEQREKVTELAGNKLKVSVVRPYVAKKDGVVVGTAYFDGHRVRTKNEVLMVVVTPQQTIERIEVLAFGEPPDYIPRDKWYALFEEQDLSEDLRMGARVPHVTGATLTVRATTDAARRILALHRVLHGAPQPVRPDDLADGERTKTGERVGQTVGAAVAGGKTPRLGKSDKAKRRGTDRPR